jgi:hypothetical protein
MINPNTKNYYFTDTLDIYLILYIKFRIVAILPYFQRRFILICYHFPLICVRTII